MAEANAVLADQSSTSDQRLEAVTFGGRQQLVAVRQRAEERQSELGLALESARAEVATLQQNLVRSTAEAGHLRQESGQQAREAQEFNSDLARQIEDENLLLRSVGEENLQLQGALCREQSQAKEYREE